ncbi:small subunit ribosomal protein S1 [Evansella vedderi]|uniref:Small subunit ribosomal protein S1 n=1 Tax=Evansella vedderi TaxID=38282 RepID=A0ABT9ZWA3_9BACI|nr:30S ribosomal protein S1 [Evansella vedderi]MDQ0255509.1 small subunit ribosomal protein S1 [Evansella vedderi]
MAITETEQVQVSQDMIAWANVKDSHKTQSVLYAKAIGIEEIPLQSGRAEECLKLNYDGIYGYLPKTLIDDYEFKGLQHFLGKEFEFVVEHVDLESQMFVGNRKKALDILAKKFWKQAKVGNNYEAFVRGIDPYNVYLIVDGVPTTMYRDEYSYSFIEDLREELEIGDIIDVKITKLVKPNQKYKKNNSRGDEVQETAGENGVLEVSSRLLQKDPWTNITNYKPKSTYLGTITKVHMEHGLFIELEPGLSVRTNFPPNSNGQLFKKGQQVNVKLLEVNPKNRRIKAIVITPKKSIGNRTTRRRGLVR